jgi:hypothetical protein
LRIKFDGSRRVGVLNPQLANPIIQDASQKPRSVVATGRPRAVAEPLRMHLTAVLLRDRRERTRCVLLKPEPIVALMKLEGPRRGATTNKRLHICRICIVL